MTMVNPASEPVLVRADEAEALGAGSTAMRLIADGGPGGGISAVRTTMAKDSDGPPPHLHKASPEIFFVLDGGLHVLLGERIVTVRAGDYLLVPPHTPHAFRTPSGTGVDMLFLMPGAERFEYFRLAERVRQGRASPQEILETQERFDNHFQDSVVWRRFVES